MHDPWRSSHQRQTCLPCAAKPQSFLSLRLLGCLSRLPKVSSRRCSLATDLVHLFARASSDALLLGVNICIESLLHASSPVSGPPTTQASHVRWAAHLKSKISQ